MAGAKDIYSSSVYDTEEADLRMVEKWMMTM
jgi:hypothetical protein